MPRSSTKAVVPVSYGARSRNSVVASNLQTRGPRQPQRQVKKGPRRAPREQRRRIPSLSSVKGPLHRAVAMQLDRLMNPRVHYGDTQPRAGSVGGIVNSMTKTIASVTTAETYLVVTQCSQINQGILTATSASATTDFGTINSVTGSSTFASSQMSQWNWSSSSLSAAIGTAALSAGGFVTVGSMLGSFTANAASLGALDPGDLINMPGASTMPLWDFVNKPWTGFMRKVSPVADEFTVITDAYGMNNQIMVPFILFHIPAALISAFTVMILSYNTYDFIPDVTDSSIPALTPPHTALDVTAYDVAKTCIGRIASGFIEALVSSASSGRVGSDFLQSYEQLTGDYGFSNRLGRLGVTYV
jgi:hypothetical protein